MKSIECLCLSISGVTALAVTGCSQPTPAEPPPVPVTVSRPLIQEVSHYVLIDGRSEASSVFEVRTRVEGFLEEPEFKEGGLVENGETLFKIETDQYQADLDAAKAQLEAAMAQLASARAQRESAIAANRLAEAELKRTEELHSKNVATDSELELKKAQEQVSSAAISDAKAGIDVANAAISRETANERQAQIQFDYTTIKSQLDGLAGEILVDPGNVVGKGENTLLTTVRQIDPLDIYFEAPERVVLKHLRAIYENRRDEHRELKIEVQFEGEEGYPHQGTLVLVDNRIDPTTGTTLLKGRISNPYRPKDNSAQGEVPFKDRLYLLLPGAYARIRIKTEPIPNAVLVHENAIGTDLTGKYLLIVNDENKVELRRVRLGQRYHQFRLIEAMWKPEETEPVTADEPVDPDFQYVLDGLLRARPGVTVKISEKVELKYPEDEAAVSVEQIDNPASIEKNEGGTTRDATPGPSEKASEKEDSEESPRETKS